MRQRGVESHGLWPLAVDVSHVVPGTAIKSRFARACVGGQLKQRCRRKFGKHFATDEKLIGAWETIGETKDRSAKKVSNVAARTADCETDTVFCVELGEPQ